MIKPKFLQESGWLLYRKEIWVSEKKVEARYCCNDACQIVAWISRVAVEVVKKRFGFK